MTNVISRIWLAGGLFALTITIFALFSMPASAGRIDNQALINGLLANLIEDLSQALQILRPLAEKGEPLAQMFLGRLYEKGEGAPFDCAEAVKWFTRAAEQGDVDAQFGLGSLHHQGQCVAKNDRTAVIWFERSGKKGDPRGLSAIGEIYLGHGDIPTDYGKAIVWFLRAAMLADAEAIYKLGVLNALGQGVPKDNLEAYKWFYLAAAFTYPGADRDKIICARDAIREDLTPAQVAEAARTAEEWLAALRQGLVEEQYGQR